MQEVEEQLKDFQKGTVSYVYNILKEDGHKRFLVADEVGLGKTMIAKGVIDKFLQENSKEFNIVYICTNQAIANQNIKTLNYDNFDKDNSRISLLPIQATTSSSVKLKAFTINTSLETKRNKFGKKEERELLAFLLYEIKTDKGSKSRPRLSEYFKGKSEKENFDFRRFTFAKNKKTKKFNQIEKSFYNEFKKKVLKKYKKIDYLFDSLKDINNRADIVKSLRDILIEVSLEKYVKPDLIILDEFQRFIQLLTKKGEEALIANKLFHPENKSKILLLSATPYKLYGDGKSHYSEFYELINWLNGEETSIVLSQKFKDYKVNFDKYIKKDIESILFNVMCRTERVHFQENKFDAMIETKKINLHLKEDDLNEFTKYANLNIPHSIRYANSAPSFVNFMSQKGYKGFKQLFQQVENKNDFNLKKEQLKDLSHPKLRALKNEIENQELDKCIWLPPLKPYVRTKGVKLDDKSKILLFSQWDFVPNVITAILNSQYQVTDGKNNTYTDDLKDIERIKDELLVDKNPYIQKIVSYTDLINKTTKETSFKGFELLLFLGSPLNCIYRALEENGIEDRKLVKRLSDMFIRFFGRFENHTIIKEKMGEFNSKAILKYCIRYNFQAMIDEFLHLMFDNPSFSDHDTEDFKRDIICAFEKSLRIYPGEVKVISDFEVNESFSVTGKFAMRIGQEAFRDDANQKDDCKELRSDSLKTAFNSPFAPFILSTTSIGQEGLDFHKYCHQIWHWNLPYSPIDLEQREGRISRYKNYAVRKNIAFDYKGFTWKESFGKAKAKLKCDFKTFWLYEGDMINEDRKNIERVIPIFPFTKEYQQYKYLLEELKTYRLALGQRREEPILDKEDEFYIENFIKLKPPTVTNNNNP